MSKRAIFLYNKKSGRATIAQKAHKIVNILRQGGYDATGEVIDFTRDQLEGRGEFDLVVVAGGDGTVNYVVNVMKQGGVKARLGIIPAGTANDFALALGMSKNPLKAAQQIATGVVDRVDCGYVNGLFFVNVFSFGVFTTTSQRTPDALKHRLGKLAYIIEGIKELNALHDMDLRIAADDKTFRIKSLMVLVLNGKTAGGFQLARKASVTDGKFDCLILEQQSFVSAIYSAFIYILGGRPSKIRYINASNIQILSDENEPTDADGQRGVDFPLNIECLRGELEIVIPRE